jgi:hypothetical protein
MSTCCNVCFMHFRCMLHMIHLNVAKIDLVLRMLQWLYTYVASMFQMFQLFQTYVVSVLSEYYICCSGYTYMLQASIQNILFVSDVYCKYFHLDVAYVPDICCKRLFKMFYLFQMYIANKFIWIL